MPLTLDVTYTPIEYSRKKNIDDMFTIVDGNAYYILGTCNKDEEHFKFNGVNLEITKSNLYKIDLMTYPKGCPMANLPIHVEVVNSPEYLDIKDNVSDGNGIYLYGLFPAGTILRFYTNPRLLRCFKCVELAGQIEYSDIPKSYDAITEIDANSKLRYIDKHPDALTLVPFIPFPAPGENDLLGDQYPEHTSVFPWGINRIPYEDPTPPSVLPDPYIDGTHDRYDKHNSLHYIVPFYVAEDSRKTKTDQRDVTLFLKNFDVRGYSNDPSKPNWQRANELKKVYMSAVTIDKLQFYLERIESYVNTAFADVSVYGEPFVSSFQRNTVLFFLRMHLGSQEYPDYVINYFSKFVELIGDLNPDSPTRLNQALYGNLNIKDVLDYFKKVVATLDDESTLVYWWKLSGMPDDSLVTEAVHDIIAFSQFTNTLYQIIYTSIPDPLNPGHALHEKVPLADILFPLPSPLNGLFPTYPNFFEKYLSAPNSTEQLSIIREAFRMFSPNSTSFSNLKPFNPDENFIQARHIHQLIMIENESTDPYLPVPPFTLLPATVNQLFNYFKYDTSRYADFIANLDGLEGLPVNNDFDDNLVQSALDQETVIDVTPSPMVRPITPIYPKPTYCPFGLGYRRCAGETFTYLVVSKLLEKFATVTFKEVKPADADWKEEYGQEIAIAPFIKVKNNIIVQKL